MVTNPLGGVLEGMIQGHQLAQQLHRQMQEDQAFKTNQALHEQNLSMQDIMNRQILDRDYRPVSDLGTIDSPAVAAPDSGVPGVGPGPGLPSFSRKPDSSRTVTYGGRKFERKSEEELQQSAIDDQVKKSDALEMAKGEQAQRVRGRVLQMRGVELPQDIASALRMQPGTMVLPEEIPGLAQHAQAVVHAGYEKLGPGDTLYAPGTPGAAPGAAPSVNGGPAMPGIDTPEVKSIWFPESRTAAVNNSGSPATSATGAPAVNPTVERMKVIARGGDPNPTGESAEFQRNFEAGYYQENGITNPTAKDRKAAWTAFLDKKSQSSVNETELELRAARGDKDAQKALATSEARRVRIASAGRALATERGIDHEVAQYGKPFEDIVKGADGQLDKILDAEKMLAGGAVSQALGIPKILTALVSGAGSGVRITQAELNSITKARGIGGDIEGFFNKLSGKGTLTTDQQKQMQSILEDVRQRIVEKKMIARSVGDDMYAAKNRDEVIAAAKKGRDSLDSHAAKGSGTVQYTSNGQTYAIPAGQEAEFLKDHPQAVKANGR